MVAFMLQGFCNGHYNAYINNSSSVLNHNDYVSVHTLKSPSIFSISGLPSMLQLGKNTATQWNILSRKELISVSKTWLG